MAAFTSVLNPRAKGFEDSKGKRRPEGSGERFNPGMVSWFYIRPWFGGVIAGVAFWGIKGGLFGNFEVPPDNPEQWAFYGFGAGLLAKTLIEIVKGLLKNIFKSS